MTNDHWTKLRVDFYDPGLSPQTANGIFNQFKVNSEADKYLSTIVGYTHYYFIKMIIF